MSLTWLLYNLQLWRRGRWSRKFTVFTSNILISPRPSELTPGLLLIDISSHLISSCFSFPHSSCLIYPLSSPPPLPPHPLIESLLEFPDSLLFIKMPYWLLVLCVEMLGKGHEGIIFCKTTPNNSQLKGLFFQILCKSWTFYPCYAKYSVLGNFSANFYLMPCSLKVQTRICI